MHVFSVKTSAHEELLDITSRVEAAVRESGIMDGICCVYTPHTTAAITINENADPDVRRDLLKGLRHLGLESVSFDHAEGNSPSHVKRALSVFKR